jgi:FkbM family methyltransferase
LIKQTAHALHKRIAGGPKGIAKLYIAAMSVLSRRLPIYLSARIQNSITQFKWPEPSFKPKSVIFPHNIEIFLVPHLGEFDQSALFKKKLDYEITVFGWLAEHALHQWDKIIEIGANIGIYTVFLDALINSTKPRLRKIIAFEPSLIPYRRLVENLSINRSQHVDVFNAAVGTKSGLQSFFEPAGHLTNGSLLQEFAAIFADTVTETTVLVIGAHELERYFVDTNKVLIKIDV